MKARGTTKHAQFRRLVAQQNKIHAEFDRLSKLKYSKATMKAENRIINKMLHNRKKLKRFFR